MSVGVVILAAGSSSRMGQSKQLLQIGNESLLTHSTRIALHAGASKVIVVLGSNEVAHRKSIENTPVEIVVNTRWHAGIGSSIKLGLAKLTESDPSIQAVVLMVCDQPLLTADHLASLIATFYKTKNAIVATAYAGSVGSPALFSSAEFKKIMLLDDHSGAQSLLKENANVTQIIFEPAGIDLDTPKDYSDFLMLSKGD